MVTRSFKSILYLIIALFLVFALWSRPNLHVGDLPAIANGTPDKPFFDNDNIKVVEPIDDKASTPAPTPEPTPEPKSSKLKISIHVFSSPERHSSFIRLWDSINTAQKPKDTEVNIVVHVNPGTSGSSIAQQNVEDSLFDNLNSSLGPVALKFSRKKEQLRHYVLRGWSPSDYDEYAILLEDDVTVSPLFLKFAEQSIKTYYYSEVSSELARTDLVGVSLHSITYDDVHMRSFKPTAKDTDFKPFLLQFPDTWGAIYSGRHWSRFISWYSLQDQEQLLVPYSLTNRWTPKAHWRKALYRWMFETGTVMAFPNLPKGISFVTFHDSLDQKAEIFSRINARAPALLKPSSPLEPSSLRSAGIRSLSPFQMEPAPLSDLIKYNNQFAKVDRSANLTGDPTFFGKCTMMMTVYSRHATIRDRLDHYHLFDELAAIVVVWNNPNVVPPTIMKGDYAIPVHILRQEVNSINNRFKPRKEIATACVINMDDDWDMPHNHIQYASEVWHRQFFDYLVGFQHEGRSHRRKIDGTWAYSKRNKQAVSMMLPSGFVYDSRYLNVYTEQLPAKARKIVDDLMNCDDILFNFMFANLTNKAPIVISYHAKALEIGVHGGLWKDPTHFAERDWCVNKYVQIFGRMPLRFTNYFFNRRISRAAFNNAVPAITDIKHFRNIKEAVIDRQVREKKEAKAALAKAEAEKAEQRLRLKAEAES